MGRGLSTSHRRRSLIAVLLTFAIASLSATIVFPILAPLFLSTSESIITKQIPESLRAILLGLFLASFPLAQFLFAPLVGEYADRRGRKGAYLITIALEVIGYFISAVAIHGRYLILLFIGRFITGLAAGNMSVCLATMVDLSPNKETKVRYFSYGSAVAGVMFVLGPFLGGKLSDPGLSSFFNLAFPMWVGGVLAIINFLVIWALFKETLQSEKREPFDPMMAIHNVQLAFKTRQVRDLYIIYFFFLFAWNMLYQFMPAVMVEEFASNSSSIGDVSALMGGVWIVGTLCMNFLLHRTHKKKAILLFSLLLFSFLTVFIPIPNDMKYFLIITGLAVFFAGGMWPVFTGAISNAADQSIQGKVLGLSSSIQSLSMMLAPLLGGFFLQAHTQVPFVIAAISALLGATLLTKTEPADFGV